MKSKRQQDMDDMIHMLRTTILRFTKYYELERDQDRKDWMEETLRRLQAALLDFEDDWR